MGTNGQHKSSEVNKEEEEEEGRRNPCILILGGIIISIEVVVDVVVGVVFVGDIILLGNSLSRSWGSLLLRTVRDLETSLLCKIEKCTL